MPQFLRIAALSPGGGQDTTMHECIVRVANGDIYIISMHILSSNDFMYKKSSDGGLTWTQPAQIEGTKNITLTTVWYDRWTPGDTGNIIHIWYGESTTDDIYYRSLDVTTDTLSGAVTVYAGATMVAGANTCITGCKTRGGNLLVMFDANNGAEKGLYRSTDAGANWTARTDPTEGGDYFSIHPGNYADNQDADIIFLDRSANELSLKVYDDSADSTAETSIAGSIVDAATSAVNPFFHAVVRPSDGHLIVASWNDRDQATADLLLWDINGAASITAKTNVVSNSDDCQAVAIFIDTVTDYLYVFYIGKSDGSEVVGAATGVYFKRSTDGGTTWGSEQTLISFLAAYNVIRCTRVGAGFSNCRVTYGDLAATTTQTLYVAVPNPANAASYQLGV